MQDGIGATGYAFHPELTIGRMEQGQEFGRAIADILVGLPFGLPEGLPTMTGVGLGLKRPGLIRRPDSEAESLTQQISLFN